MKEELAFRFKLIWSGKRGIAISILSLQPRLFRHLARIEIINYRIVFLGENKDSFNILIFMLVTSIGHCSLSFLLPLKALLLTQEISKLLRTYF